MSSEPVSVALWGPIGSGKTWLLEAFARKLFLLGRQFEQSGNFRLQLLDLQTSKPVRQERGPTRTGTADTNLHSYLFVRKGLGKGLVAQVNSHAHIMNIFDNRGRDLVRVIDPYLGTESEIKKGSATRQLLQEIENLILVVDPGITYFEDNPSISGYAQYLEELRYFIRKRYRRIAVCLTKMDMYGAGLEHSALLAPLVSRKFSPQEADRILFTLRGLVDDGHDVAFSAVSAAGYLELDSRRAPNIEPIANMLVDVSRWEPVNVETPFFWLLERIERRKLERPSPGLSGLLNSRIYRNNLVAARRRAYVSYAQMMGAIEEVSPSLTVPTQVPIHVEFFRQIGFDVSLEPDNVLLLEPQSPAYKKQYGSRSVAKIIEDHPPKVADIQEVAKVVQKVSKERGLTGQVAFVVANQLPDGGARAQMFAYRFEYNFVLIPFTFEHLRAAQANGTSQEEFDSAVNKYLHGQPDLYHHVTPVYDDGFYGREREAEELLARLSQNQPVSIFALNKMGKTSLVNNLAGRLKNRAVAVVDLQALAHEAGAVYKAVIGGLETDIRSKWPAARIPSLRLAADEPPVDLVTAFTDDLKALHTTLAQEIPNPRFAIFIDEIDRLVPGENESQAVGFAGYKDILALLRGLSQQGFPLTFVVIGIHARINRAAQLAGVENAGFRMFHELFLPPMTEDECNQMINDIGQQMGLKYGPAALRRVYLESGGHPFLARQLCSLAWRRLGESQRSARPILLNEFTIVKAADAFIDSGDHASYFEELWSIRLNEVERAVVRQLAEANAPQPRQKGERQAFNSLLEQHIITQEDELYHLTFGLFRRWIRAHVLGLDE